MTFFASSPPDPMIAEIRSSGIGTLADFAKDGIAPGHPLALRATAAINELAERAASTQAAPLPPSPESFRPSGGGEGQHKQDLGAIGDGRADAVDLALNHLSDFATRGMMSLTVTDAKVLLEHYDVLVAVADASELYASIARTFIPVARYEKFLERCELLASTTPPEGEKP